MVSIMYEQAVIICFCATVVQYQYVDTTECTTLRVSVDSKQGYVVDACIPYVYYRKCKLHAINDIMIRIYANA